MNFHHFTIKSQIRKYCACAEMASLSKDGIANIVHMRSLGAIHEYRIFNLTAVSDDRAFSNYNISAQVGSRAYSAILSDPQWTKKSGTRINFRTAVNKNPTTKITGRSHVHHLRGAVKESETYAR
jgi:hypothetical protein